MRCKACNATLKQTPLWVKLADGTRILNDLCSTCTFIATNPDLCNYEDSIFKDEDDFVHNIIKQNIKRQVE